MFEACSCGTGGRNTGQPNCIPTIKSTSRIIVMRSYANDGTRNSIKKTDFVNGVLPEAFIDDKLNETDASKRWYLTSKINNITDTRAEPTTFDIDGVPFITNQGARSFAGSFYSNLGSPTYAGVLNSFSCFQNAYYEVSVEGAIVGMDGGDDLYPIGIQTGTLNAAVVKGSKTEPNSVLITFAVDELERDENMIQIGASAIEANLLNKRGLIDVVGSALDTPTITATAVRVDLGFIYGNFNSKIPFEGLTAADLSYDGGTTTATVFNVDQSASVVVSSVTPVLGSAGLYDLVIASGGLTTEVISVALSKNGYEMTAFTYIIP